MSIVRNMGLKRLATTDEAQRTTNPILAMVHVTKRAD